MRRRILGVAAAALLASVATALPAESSSAATVTFTGRLAFTDGGDNDAAPEVLWAPVSPACGATPCPVPQFQVLPWIIDTATGPLGQRLCVAAHSDEGLSVRGAGVAIGPACSVTGDGVFGAGANFVGPYCGYGNGAIHLTVTVGGTTKRLNGVNEHQTGTTSTWVLFDPGVGRRGVGVMEQVEPTEGACGLNPADGHRPATGFTFTMTLTYALP